MYRFIKNFLFLFTGKPRALRSNETIDLILHRRSCRSFTDADIAREDLQTVLEAGRFSPSTVNLQTWTFITFDRRQWRATFDRPLPFNGAQAIVICADPVRLGHGLLGAV